VRVLFVGNSYTFVNDLPAVLHGLAVASGDSPAIEVSSVTVGGATLQTQWQGPDAQAAIAKGGHEFVVIQGQSVEPVGDPTTFQAYAALFADAATKAHAQPAFYETWARKPGDALYAEAWTGGSADAMQDGLLGAYSTARTRALSAGPAKLVPVGEAFRDVRVHHPTIELYQADGSHPSAAGTYLAACVFYDVLVGRTFVATSGVPAGVAPVEAPVLRDAASAAVAAHP
jgi:hypothetical protein